MCGDRCAVWPPHVTAIGSWRLQVHLVDSAVSDPWYSLQVDDVAIDRAKRREGH